MNREEKADPSGINKESTKTRGSDKFCFIICHHSRCCAYPSELCWAVAELSCSLLSPRISAVCRGGSMGHQRENFWRFSPPTTRPCSSQPSTNIGEIKLILPTKRTTKILPSTTTDVLCKVLLQDEEFPSRVLNFPASLPAQ